MSKITYTTLINICLCLIMLLSASTCKNENVEPESSLTDANPYACQTIQINDHFESLSSDPFTIEKSIIEGDCLKLSITYGGGCGGAVFSMYRHSSVSESDSPQLQMDLALDDKDHCRAIIYKDIFFDLSTIRVVLAGKPLALKINGVDTPVVYIY